MIYMSKRKARRVARWNWIDDHMLMMAMLLLMVAWAVVIAFPIFI